jgi:Calcineurin-like phosphoesterase
MSAGADRWVPERYHVCALRAKQGVVKVAARVRLSASGAVILVALSIGCSGSTPVGPTPPGRGPGPPVGGRSVTLVGAGDIGMCGSPGTIATGQLVEATPGEVFLAGDIAYPQGTVANLYQCFDPYWGHARDRWHAVPGNHDYETQRGLPYYQYFGEAAGDTREGYYQFSAGEWLVLMINSNEPTDRNSPQYAFVRNALVARRPRCTLAIWHHPRFSSGPNGPQVFMQDMWELLYEHAADVVIAAHDHFYERFFRQDAIGQPDNERGIRQFIVGTGGGTLSPFIQVAPNSGQRVSAFGVLKITLQPDAYNWEFLETSGRIGDTGFTQCH